VRRAGLISRVEGWLFAPGDPRRLAALRIGLGAALAARAARPLYLQLAGQPAALFRPVSFMRLLPHMPPRAVVLAMQVVGVGAALLAVAGLGSRAALPVAWLAGVFLGGMTASTGKLTHNDVLLLVALVPLLPAPVDDAWSVRSLRRGSAAPPGTPATAAPRPPAAHGWPVRTAMLAVAFTYFFIGVWKVVFSGPAWVASGNLRWILYASSDGQSSPNQLGLLIADRPWLAHLVAAATLLVELGFPVVLWRPRAAWFFVPAAVALHLGIQATMHLDYWPWIVTVVVVFVDWPRLADRVRPRGRQAAVA
jgi:hypothetical protein